MKRMLFLDSKIFWAFGLIFSVLFSNFCLSAQALPGDKLKDVTKFENFADALIINKMAEYHIPGVALVVVKDGKVFFKKGYGYADLENKVPIDTNKTVFPIASITKSITATAVMQLVERGKIDLKADINRYLKHFKIRNPYVTPVTMFNLLTHTAGFDEVLMNTDVYHKSKKMPLAQFLKESMPSLVDEPGEVISYSNYGLSLAGYIVEAVSKRKYEEYIEQNIFKPLDMKNSFFMNLDNVNQEMALSYTYDKGRYTSHVAHDQNTGPAASVCSTAEDMARFLIAQLQKGNYGGQRILKQETVLAMQRRQFSNIPNMLGAGYGFFEELRGGNRVLEHGGDTHYYSSMLSLMPENNIGFFMATNTLNFSGEGLRVDFANEFYQQLFPHEAGVQEKISAKPAGFDPKSLTGSYTYVRTAQKSIFKLFALPAIRNLSAKVSFDEQGNLQLKCDRLPEVALFDRISDLLFQSQKDGSYAAFKEVNHHQVYLFWGNSAWVKSKWYQNDWINLGIMAGILFFFAIHVLSGFIRYLSGRLKKRNRKYEQRMVYLRRMTNAMCGVNLIFVAGLISYLITVIISNEFRVTVFLKGVMFMPIISSMITAVLLVMNILVINRKLMPVKTQIYNLIITLAGVGFIVLLHYFNLLGWRLY